MVELRENYWAVEVPEGATGLDVNHYQVGSELNYWVTDGGKETLIIIDLPPGTWEIVCTSKEATEEQAVNLIQWSEWHFPVKHTRYIDYTRPYDTALKQKWGDGFGTALESFNSLLASKGCDVNKNYLILKKQ